MTEFLVTFLTPFKHATKLVEGIMSPSLHLTFKTYEHLFNYLDQIKQGIRLKNIKLAWIREVQTAIVLMWTKM